MSLNKRLRNEWQFNKNITLEHPEQGDLILDILKDGQIGGVEFWEFYW
jgi:uncharacterized protein YuzE